MPRDFTQSQQRKGRTGGQKGRIGRKEGRKERGGKKKRKKIAKFSFKKRKNIEQSPRDLWDIIKCTNTHKW